MRFSLKQRPFRLAVGASLVAFLTVAAAGTTVAQQEASSKDSVLADSGLHRTQAASAAERAALSLTFLPSTASAHDAIQPSVGSKVGTGHAVTPNAPLRGPRIPPGLRSVKPDLAWHGAPPPDPAAGDSHTIVISTLAIVLIAVIVTILVVN